MRAPFLLLVKDAYFWLIPILTAAFVTFMMQKRIAERQLHRPGLKRPIVDWEMAGTSERLNAIKVAWGPEGRRQAAFTLIWDLPFLVAYGFGLALASSIGAAAFLGLGWKPVAFFFSAIAWAAIVAAALDVIENFLLSWTLGRDVRSDGIPAMTRVIAKIKFKLVPIAVLFALISIGIDLLSCRFGCVR